MSGDRQPISKQSSTDQTKRRTLRQNPFTCQRDPETGEWQVFLRSVQASSASSPSVRPRRHYVD